MSTLHYVGQELGLFAHATNWKGYWTRLIVEYIHGDVLEVGAGLGVNTPYLNSKLAKSWTCLEPDPALAAQLRKSLSPEFQVIVGTTRNLEPVPRFDSILYIDVLEHIADDRGELEYAARLLRPDGSLIVLSPAHQWLYSPFDQSIGHERRYNRSSLKRCSPSGFKIERLAYLDCCGLLASAANRLFLKQSMPTLKEVRVWDGVLVPCSTVLDRLTGFTIGKSIFAVWKKQTLD
jgi:SAM-dependent methyltransferase